MEADISCCHLGSSIDADQVIPRVQDFGIYSYHIPVPSVPPSCSSLCSQLHGSPEVCSDWRPVESSEVVRGERKEQFMLVR